MGLKLKPLVAFQGERGAYSEEAAIKYFGSGVNVVACKTMAEVFAKVENNEVDYGIVPVENSIEGSVNETYDLLVDTKLKISGELNLRIIHCLIAHPNVDIQDIKVIYSHPQALAQCKKFLNGLNCEVISAYDTAGSVKMIKEKGLIDAAAIASERSSEIYGMKILKKGIEDSLDNYTRFLILSHNDSPFTGNDKTSIIFSTKHVPGALYNALREFAVRGINLTMILSRPTKKTPWEYNFFVDFEGHRTEKRVEECLKELKNQTLFVKVLGSYPKAKP
ncbi:MAG: prephenate dehydratase [Nitrososphaerota archaeon]|nr:prephenate dehydratase [Nitrososphaerales archaeon]MDW8045260.1 prephenate dehydratase [Nitrososphaerota archaeon]